MRINKDDVYYICGYRLVYPVLKKELYNTKVNFYSKYLIALNSDGDFRYFFISRVHIERGYELYSNENKKSNFFKLCRAVWGIRSIKTLKYADIKPNDLIKHYFAVKNGEFVKAPDDFQFKAILAGKCISFFTNSEESMVKLDRDMVLNYIKTMSISIGDNNVKSF